MNQALARIILRYTIAILATTGVLTNPEFIEMLKTDKDLLFLVTHALASTPALAGLVTSAINELWYFAAKRKNDPKIL